MATLLEQLDAMRTMKSNWDGYNADAPEPAAIDLAAELVRLFAALRPDFESPAVYVTPTTVGGVMILWEDAEYEHELDIDPDGAIEVMHTRKSTGAHTIHKLAPGSHQVTPQVFSQIRYLLAA